MLATAWVVAACAPLPPQPPAPTPRAPARLALERSVATPLPAERWWREFGDPQLDAWVERALAEQPSLAVAAARAAQAQAAVRQRRAAALPQAHLGADAALQRYSEHGLVPPSVAGKWRDSYGVQLSGGWELDFFDRHGAAVRAAVGAHRAALAEQQAARTLLAAQVVRAWIQLAGLHEQVQQVDSLLALRQRMQELTAQRADAGLDPRVAVLQAEGELPLLRAQREALAGEIALARHQLAAWAALPPEAAVRVAPRLAPLAVPPLPPRLGLDLLGRRAEVVAARWRVESAADAVAEARAAYMPDVNLLAFAGMSALGLQHIVDIGSRTAGATAALRLPIFEGARLDAQLDARHAEHAAAVAAYDAAVVQAVREAADAASLVQAAGRQQHEQAQALAAAEGAAALAAQRQRAGLGGALPALALQVQAQLQMRAGAELKVRALDAQARLMQALGGGYDCPGCAVAAQR